MREVAAEPLRVPIDELERAIAAVLDHVRARRGEVAEIDVDLFWSVPAEERFDMTWESPTLTVGQVSESWGWIEQALAGSEEDLLLYHLVWLADVR